jgi:hypothetical protein
VSVDSIPIRKPCNGIHLRDQKKAVRTVAVTPWQYHEGRSSHEPRAQHTPPRSGTVQ